MRRIASDPVEARTGDMIETASCFGCAYYPVRSDEVTVPKDQAAIFKHGLAARLAAPGHLQYLCGFDPGIFVTLYRLNDDHQELLAGHGLICFRCGEWRFTFQSDDDAFSEAMPPETFDAILRVAQATFPHDQILQGVTPR